MKKINIIEFSAAINALELYEKQRHFPQWIIRHQKEVFLMAYQMGESLGFGQEELTALSIAARFHDIGKGGVDPVIINNERELDEKQRCIIFNHVHLSRQILKDNNVDSEIILDAVFCHHENFDGSGYPRKLSAEKIPVEAQILRIVDSFSAMLGKRPYRNANGKNFDNAIQQISQGSGTYYSPEMVKVFLRSLLKSSFNHKKELSWGGISEVLFQ